MRDGKDNVVIVCSIENFDPMGIHTGDSITVAPAQTLTDKEYQLMRDASVAVIRAIGVDTGGSNIQFAVHPENGRMIVIEMNPRVSRSSALASKATGFPIAKIAAKLAVGYTLDEIRNDITRETPACFEPTIDYVVTKIPRFTFEKFPQAGRRARAADEVRRRGHGDRAHVQGVAPEGHALARDRQHGLRAARGTDDELRAKLRRRDADRLWWVGEAFRRGLSVEEVSDLSKIDPWFLRHIDELMAEERLLAGAPLDALSEARLRGAQAGGLLGRPAGQDPRRRRGRRACAAREHGHPAGLQDGRHVRRRIRRAHAVPLFDL
jgi:carbamoyl-phosphate synthase large subunit